MKTIAQTIADADAKLNKKQGYSANCISGFYDTLQKTGCVEVGWRECCGTRHITATIRAEWVKIVKAIKQSGTSISVEPVKHKNGYATNNGGFWNSEIFRINIAEGKQ